MAKNSTAKKPAKKPTTKKAAKKPTTKKAAKRPAKPRPPKVETCACETVRRTRVMSDARSRALLAEYVGLHGRSKSAPARARYAATIRALGGTV